jgi:hypothetical protein
MAFFLLICGFLLFLLGLAYVFSPKLVLRFNAFARETFFKDSTVLLANRRVGTLLLLVAFVLIILSHRGFRQIP